MFSSDDRYDATVNPAAQAPEVNPMAYIKPVTTEKGPAFGVYSADGAQLALFSSREAAFFAAKQHDLEPVLLH